MTKISVYRFVAEKGNYYHGLDNIDCARGVVHRV